MIDVLRSAINAAAEVAYKPDDGIDLLGLLIIYAPAWLPALGTLAVVVHGQRKGRDRRDEDRAVLADMSEKVEVVKREVKNDHPDDQNMRDQIDRIEQAVHAQGQDIRAQGEDIREIRQRQIEQGRDIGGIREEIRTERKERIAGDRRWQ
ncbi:hypothetical protein SEA_TORTELLINI_28 [Mycobacterium phage Tortellini]|uniref:Minor tail protein n=1 Tax=Mycobacterium phage Tortellini TaxID=1897497 RepID=A0A1D8EX29_9CAUD|nr:DUF2746 domain-containing protein [Mycobacterium phage Tortellini]AOT25773.1 hypothetical protein SEA_TORTELLINI_28 [Mycobacterium phage Tortellini]